ncbi:MAG: metallo-beta-lactamase family protein [Planctomycetota bacterium]|jgi:metallo-beta-lactamase family protein
MACQRPSSFNSPVIMSISLQFLGAARRVTGSKHLLTVGKRRVLMDCGMVQGPRKIANKLNQKLPFLASSIDAVVLSHAHVDHSGSLPRLVRMGYRGPIYCTPATRDLLEILLPDSAHIQASDAKYLKKKGIDFQPAYEMEDVERTLGQIETVPYNKPFAVLPDVEGLFIDAGHIIGSAQICLQVGGQEGPLRINFTGDLGRSGIPILRDPDPLPECDVLLTESTYGDRVHPPGDTQMQQFRAFIQEQSSRRGRILIPAFSVGRTQNILWYLGRMIHEGLIDPLPIYVDSPLSNKATAVVARHRDLYDEETRAMIAGGQNPFFFEGVRCIADVEESKALNEITRGIIISASGMCEGGRILHHLLHSLERFNDSILITGFQAQGTVGRKLLDGYEFVKIFGQRVSVRCHVEHINGLSAHADASELLEHLSPLAATTERVFVVHGEEGPAQRFADRLWQAGFKDVRVPIYKESFELRA